MMPDIYGFSVREELKSDNRTKRIPIIIVSAEEIIDSERKWLIAITANALRGAPEKALEARCDVYISKPINIRELQARVEAFLPHYEE